MIIKAIIGIVAFLVLAPFVGGLLAGLDRKLSAKMQRRVGPPVLQPFYDVGKLFQKEKQTPTRFQDFYVILFVVFIIASGVLFFMGGDLLLVIFTLTIGAAFLIIAAYSSNSPYAELGAERELLEYSGERLHAVPAAAGHLLRMAVHPDTEVQEVTVRPEYVTPCSPGTGCWSEDRVLR